MQALAWGMTNFEDALQAAAARANGAAFIISRNVKDFKRPHVPPLIPRDYLARFRGTTASTQGRTPCRGPAPRAERESRA